MAPILSALTESGPPKPVLFAMLGEESEVAPGIISALRGLGVPFFRSPERALRALARLASVAAEPKSPASLVVEPVAAPLPAGVIPEYAAKRILAEAGIPFPRAELVHELAPALCAAARIGYPVVLKAQSRTLTHKSDVGGVILNIGDEAALTAAWHKFCADIAKARPDVSLDGILVEAIARPGLELIVGVRNDPDWGPVLAVGLGGVLAEALHDLRVLAADCEDAVIVAELRKLRCSALLSGFRGSPPVDIAAVADIASRLGRFAAAHPEIAEIDINPLTVYAEGEGAIALDALIVSRHRQPN
jgi:acyl-CoA synthetase (NDP forming)